MKRGDNPSPCVLRRQGKGYDEYDVIASAMDRTEDKVSGSKLGAVDYITKPFQPEEVLARVDTHLTMHQTKYTARPGWS